MCVVTFLSAGNPCITLKPTLSTNFSSHLVVPGVTEVQTERQTNNLTNQEDLDQSIGSCYYSIRSYCHK